VKKFTVLPSDFTVENGLLTPTLKVKRKVIREQYQAAIDQLYR
jgi:long-chain acyl-CoA synthetase